MKKRLMCHVAAGVGFVLPALAQTATPPQETASPAPARHQLEDIVVTAQRKSENIQKVPIAITAVSGRQLSEHGETTSLSLIDSVPNLTMNTSGSVVNPYLRGVGTNGSNVNDEQSVATYVDGVYMGTPLGNIFAFNDVDRIEVLKGPQGTLFGRNATGGVIQIVTRDPSNTPSGQISVGYGNYNTLQDSLYLTGGLAPNLAGAIAAVFNDNLDGYGKDFATGKPTYRRNDLGLRLKLKWTPSDDTIVRLEADYQHVRTYATPYQLVPGVIGAGGTTDEPGKYNTDANWPNLANTEVFGASLHVDQDLGFARLVDITAFRNTSQIFFVDEDSTPVPFVNVSVHEEAQTFSQELQLLSKKDSKLQWLLGAYYYNALYAFAPFYLGGLVTAPLPYADIDSQQRTSSGSFYGQATYPIFADTHLTGGLRYTAEYQSNRGSLHYGDETLAKAPVQSQRFERLTWRGALDHDFTDQINGYVSYNRGIKSGGYNLSALGAAPYYPEILDAYEIGLKTRLFNNTLQLNVAGFYYSYKDIQVQSYRNGALFLENAAAADLKGFDIDAHFLPLDDLSLTAGLGYTDGHYTNFPGSPKTPASPFEGPPTVEDAGGNQLQNLSKWTLNGSADYTIPTKFGNFLVDVTATYRAKTYVSTDNRLYIPAFTLINSSVGWTSPDTLYGVQIWVQNLANELYYQSRIETTVGDLQDFGPPRTYGFTLTRKF
jgi:iron complex outermembrane receptor protein